MASSSSSSESNSQYSCLQQKCKYDVFLSFRGEDTRNNFTSHLHKALKNRAISTFLDDESLENGDSLSKELVKAIEESQVAVIIFSKNYATSRWCLNELVKIMECKEENGQLVIPVFYDVDPSHVRKQTESFANAFDEHKSKNKDGDEGMQKLQRWRTALTAAADLKGYDIRERNEAHCIEDLVNEISPKLCTTSLSSSKDIVGIDAHLEKVNYLLEMTSNDVRRVWIWGMVGVGKTTIARAIFDIHSSEFDGACFLPVSKENKHEIHSLQSILLSKLVGEKENCVLDKEDGMHRMAHRLHLKKVLVVLDNIDHADQLKYLAGNLGWFGKGSRIIATTRNKHFNRENDAIYHVTTLCEHDAVKLFNQCAFGKNEVPDKCFEEMTLEVVHHTQGLPLALVVWGSSFRNKDISRWRSAVNGLKKNFNKEIVGILKVSYDGLEPQEQEIFLDIACFLKGREQTEIKQILESCDFEAADGLGELIDKSLVFISEKDTIEMHDLIQKMGKHIVTVQREELSRLWLTEDFEEFSKARIQGARAIEAIWVQEIQYLSFRENAMNAMKNLRILYINGFHTHDGSNDQYLPSKLRWFDCCKYPWESLPEKFDPDKLVHLDLQQSSLLHLWTETTETKKFPSLRRLDLSGCENLRGTPDFKDMPNLEYLGLEECSNLTTVHHSLKDSKKLMKLNLRDCKRLATFECVSGVSLEYLDIQGCSSLEKFPRIKEKGKPEKMIRVQCSGLSELPSAMIQHLSSVTELDLSGMKNLAKLSCSIVKLKHLVILKVSYCSKLSSLPEKIGDLENLEILDAKYTLISQPPSSIVRLNRLKLLTFAKQKSEVGLEDGVHFVFPRVNGGLHSLEDLDLSYCNLIDGRLPEDIGSLSSLKVLNLRGNNFEHLPQSMAQLGSLQSLDLTDCKSLTQLPEDIGDLENLENLDARGTLISQPPSSIVRSNRLKLLTFAKQKSEVGLEDEVHFIFPPVNHRLCSLETLNLSNCNLKDRGLPEDIGSLSSLKVLNLRLELSSLKVLNLSYCNLKDGGLPEDIGSLSSLKVLNLRGNNFEHLPRSMTQLSSLQSLDLTDCKSLTQLPEDIGDLENLENLDARGTLISQPPSSIFHLNRLKLLNLSYCNLKDGGLPEDIGSLSSLKVLNIRGNNFEHLPQSMAQLGSLQSLDLTDCKSLTQLPEDIGDLVNLENLDARGTLISQPPSSIFRLNRLKLLTFAKQKSEVGLKDGVHFVFPQVNGGLHSLEYLDLSYCNLRDGGLPEDIGSLSSLKVLNLRGNNFEHLPRSMTQLSSLQSLNLLDCKSLTQLPKFKQQLDTKYDPSNDSIYNSLFYHTSSSAAGSRILLRSLKYK